VEVLQNLRALPGRSGPRLLPELIKTFFAEEPQRRAELERLASERDATALAHAAHSFAGSSAVIGARESRQVLLALEKAALAQDWDEVAKCLRDIRATGERLRSAFAELEAILA
jgi:HPt (histidine-containing phosphotransfer) domain-containing protein